MINDEFIDLTEHRDFGHNFNGEGRLPFAALETAGFWEIISERERRRLYGEIAWNVYPLNYLYPFNGLIALGNKEQRKEAKELYYWGTRESRVCDCCGKEYKKIPWKDSWGLCPNCDYDNRPSDFKFPWDNNNFTLTGRNENNGIQVFSNGNN